MARTDTEVKEERTKDGSVRTDTEDKECMIQDGLIKTGTRIQDGLVRTDTETCPAGEKIDSSTEMILGDTTT